LKITLLGGGGHAKVIIGMIRALGHEPARILDDNQSNWEKELMGVPISGPIESVTCTKEPVVIAIGNNRVRKKLSELYETEYVTLIHPAAFVDPSSKIEAGSVIFAGAVIQPEAVLGKHVIVNTCASVDHECELSDYTQIAPGAHLGGNVQVFEGAMVGIGASVHQGSIIGAWSTVGGGAFVKGIIEEGITVVGVPAKTRSSI
jgi:sugar O-acyltransferase (sialic acid O-acetyltransferase NeuD family)